MKSLVGGYSSKILMLLIANALLWPKYLAIRNLAHSFLTLFFTYQLPTFDSCQSRWTNFCVKLRRKAEFFPNKTGHLNAKALTFHFDQKGNFYECKVASNFRFCGNLVGLENVNWKPLKFAWIKLSPMVCFHTQLPQVEFSVILKLSLSKLWCRRVNQLCCMLVESWQQRLYNFDRTHLVLASGNLVQKASETSHKRVYSSLLRGEESMPRCLM